MKINKIAKVALRIFLISIAVIVLLLLISTITYHIKLNNAVITLKEKGYYNPVPVGDYSLNVYSCGNEDGKHTIVALAGLFDGEMNIGWREMTKEIEKENRLVFVDRAGYGLSDDTTQEMTVEHIVEDYRKALLNAGIEAPYILMPHSIGGLYATYWESKYPEEIEAVAFVDGSVCEPIEPELQATDNPIMKIMPVAEKLGLAELYIWSEYGAYMDFLTEEEQTLAFAMMSKTVGSSAIVSEANLDYTNVNTAWEAIVTNDIPKLYISATIGYQTTEDFNGKDLTELCYIFGISCDEYRNDEQLKEALLQSILQLREEREMPYIEKIGNCKHICLPGNHVIFMDRPEECGKLIKNFIDGLE